MSTEDVVERRDTILRQAIRDGRDEMTRMQGKNPAKWEWGRLHALMLPTPLRLVRDRTDRGAGQSRSRRGGRRRVDRPGNGWTAPDGYATNWVPSMRMVVDLADLDASRWIDLTGVSGHPYDDHYSDQTERWRTGQTLPMRWDEDTIRAGAASTLVLVPDESQ